MMTTWCQYLLGSLGEELRTSSASYLIGECFRNVEAICGRPEFRMSREGVISRSGDARQSIVTHIDSGSLALRCNSSQGVLESGIEMPK
jgi:hypothetical protein